MNPFSEKKQMALYYVYSISLMCHLYEDTSRTAPKLNIELIDYTVEREAYNLAWYI